MGKHGSAAWIALAGALVLAVVWSLANGTPAEAPATTTATRAAQPVDTERSGQVAEPPPTPPQPARAADTWRAADIGMFRFEVPGVPQPKGRVSFNADGTHVGQNDFLLSLPDGTWYRATHEPIDIPAGVDLKADRALDMGVESIMRSYVGTITSRQTLRAGPKREPRRRQVVARIAAGGTLYVSVLWLQPEMYTFQAYTRGEPETMPPEFVRFFNSARLNAAQLLDDAGK